MSYQSEIAELIRREGCNPEFWLRALETNVHTTDCREKQLSLQNSHDKLRAFIYGQTAIASKADARIAELEQSVTVRDTEIARLETDLEFARRDASRWRAEVAMLCGYDSTAEMDAATGAARGGE